MLLMAKVRPRHEKLQPGKRKFVKQAEREPPRQGRELRETNDRLQVERAHVAGNSMGGAIAIEEVF